MSLEFLLILSGAVLVLIVYHFVHYYFTLLCTLLLCTKVLIVYPEFSIGALAVRLTEYKIVLSNPSKTACSSSTTLCPSLYSLHYHGPSTHQSVRLEPVRDSAPLLLAAAFFVLWQIACKLGRLARKTNLSTSASVIAVITAVLKWCCVILLTGFGFHYVVRNLLAAPLEAAMSSSLLAASAISIVLLLVNVFMRKFFEILVTSQGNEVRSRYSSSFMLLMAISNVVVYVVILLVAHSPLVEGGRYSGYYEIVWGTLRLCGTH